jgi:transglutaminase-like putative cysteine protease
LEALRGAGVEEIARTVKERIYTGFRYEGDVTSASSPIDDLLRHGGGVCQDFTHLMLATARFLEVPARYVSGYVLPEGSGEQVVESHAWCELFDPEHGWFGVDPTHNEWADERHVRLGVGRDFRDVPPNRGVFRGLAVEELQVTVRIRPINADQLGVRTRTLVAGPRVAAPRGRQLRKPQPVSILQQTLYAQQQQQQQ